MNIVLLTHPKIGDVIHGEEITAINKTTQRFRTADSRIFNYRFWKG